MPEFGVLTVGVLGPLEVSVGGRPVVLTTGRLRTLLAVLAMSAGEAVSVDRLAAALWGEDLPADARRGVQTYVTRLRVALGAESIATTPSGYALRAESDQVDALRFAHLLEAAGRVSDPASERVLLGEALALWRGRPFDGIQSAWLEQSETPRLVERYLSATEWGVDLDLADGRHGELVARLHELTARYPLRESLWVRLLVVLDRCGRQAEALQRYESIRVRLAEELGVDPGPELRQAHVDLLAGRPLRPVDGGGPATAVALPVVPRQLPADVEGFTGRDAALKALDDLIGEGDDQIAGAVVISAIAGTAGVGKTALAVHWAHQIADRFPDGQLYVNLRGFHPSGQAMDPAEAVRGFLDALGVPPGRIPADLQAQAGLYRSMLAGKRILVVLDNARDAEQVRPLLPGSPSCLVLVTSRSQLTGLVAAEGARVISLDLLTVEEARQMLARRMGHDRLAAEPEATDEIVTRCARLPLALAIAAARTATQPTFPLQALTAELRDAQGTLAALDGGDAASDIRAVFSWSYRTLTDDAARLFRLLGLHPGPDLATPAAASLAGVPVDRVRPLLAELTRAHLVTEHTPGRYTFHDLLRAYATELTYTHDSAAEQQAARHRLLDHYLHTAHTAALLFCPPREPITVAGPQPEVTPEDIAGHRQALAWFTTEHTVLLAAITQAAETGFETHTWQLAWTLEDFLYRRGYWEEWKATHHIALEAARRLGDTAGQALAHRALAGAHAYLGRYEQAHVHLQDALDLYGQLGDRVGQARTHDNLSMVLGRQHRHIEGLRHSQRSLDLYLTAGHRSGQARALNSIGWDHAHVGNYHEGLTYCEQALTLYQELGDRTGEATAWDGLGYAHHHLGHHQQAAGCYQRALGLFRDLSNRHFEAEALTRLADTYRSAGDRDAARATWRQALTILDELGHADADQVRAKLHALDQPAPRHRGR